MNGARLLVEAIEREGVDLVFGYPGGAVLPIYDALRESSLRHVLARHEQAAAFAADGYARVTGRAGVCLATSGPGATNLVTGLANALMDSVPMVAITGQVPSSVMGTDAFQEVDVFGMTMGVVKHSFLVREAEDIPRVVREAFAIATSGRPGPVLIDIPKDVSAAEVPLTALPKPEPETPARIESVGVATARRMMEEAKRPLVYAGGGVVMADAVDAFRHFVATTGLPVVTTLKGLGAIPTDHPAFLGMLGMHGNKAANFAVQDTDLLIVVGARFDDRATGKLQGFAPKAQVIHMDADPAEVGKLRHAHVALLGDLAGTLTALSQPLRLGDWTAKCRMLKASHAWRYDAPGEGVYAPALLRDLSMAAGDDCIFSCDVGQHQMWVAQHCRLTHPSRHLTSGGLGAMGYGIPAAIGAQLARPDANVVCVTGDGSIMINVQELATLKRYELPVKIVLLDNQALGMVRQWQELFFEQRFSEIDLSDNPDFAQVARSFGIDAFTLDRRDDVPDAIDRLLSSRGPILAHVKIDPNANVWPLVPPGATNSTMLDRT